MRSFTWAFPFFVLVCSTFGCLPREAVDLTPASRPLLAQAWHPSLVYIITGSATKFEAIVPGPELFCPIIGDYFGNLLLINDANHGGVIYYASRPTAFGTVPGCTPVPIGQPGADLGAKCIWRNREFTSIGYFWMGANWYQPDGLRFLGMDALGHDGNRPDGYGICGFSPLVDWDADGRCASRLWNNAVNWAERTYANGVATMEGVIDPQTRAQTLMDNGYGGVRGAFNWGIETAEGINNMVSGRLTGYFNNLALNYISGQGNAFVNYVSSANGANPDSQAGQFGDSSVRASLTIGSMLFGSGEAKVASEGERMLASGERLLLGGEPPAVETVPKLLAAPSGYNPWVGEIRSVVAEADTAMYRVWGDESGQVAGWLSPTRPSSTLSSIRDLALPPGNSAEFVSEVMVPAGTRFQVGTAASAFGQPGGGAQVLLLDRIPAANFGPGTPLAPWLRPK